MSMEVWLTIGAWAGIAALFALGMWMLITGRLPWTAKK